jgi:hypothetical protein
MTRFDCSEIESEQWFQRGKKFDPAFLAVPLPNAVAPAGINATLSAATVVIAICTARRLRWCG